MTTIMTCSDLLENMTFEVYNMAFSGLTARSHITVVQSMHGTNLKIGV